MLAYQDIPDNITEVVKELSQNNTLAELMAIAFVLAMLSLPIFAIYLVVKTFRNPKLQDKQEDDNDMIYAVAIGKLAETFSGPLQDVTEVLRGIVASQSRQEMLMTQIKKDATEYIKNKDTIIQTGIAAVDANTAASKRQTESVNTMQAQIEALRKAVMEAMQTMTALVQGGVTLSDQDKSDIIQAVTDGLKSTIQECYTEAVKTATQETPIIQPGGTEPPLGKVVVVGKPTLGDIKSETAAYPPNTEEESKS